MNPLTTQSDGDGAKRQMMTVSELTAAIKHLLETNFSFIWVCGEISNFRVPGSGHFYFTLKDESAQISGVMFRGQNRRLKFLPEDGMEIVGLGRVSVYAPRGAYQLIFEYLEPKGAGALQVAFEQLKEKLAAEGLFDPVHKQPIPYLPDKISIITSPSGAVVHDIIRVVQRRFPNVSLQVVPVRVQGTEAESEIAEALEQVNRMGDADLIILARGGGSLEDLWAFNTETVARAVSASRIPVISAVGHETDFTISDFVADLRAPTPSAAAELVVPVKYDLVRGVEAASHALRNRMLDYIEIWSERARGLSNRLIDPARQVEDLRLRLDEIGARLLRALGYHLDKQRRLAERQAGRLGAASPVFQIAKLKSKLEQISYKLQVNMKICNNVKRSSLQITTGRLQGLNPSDILARGYSITRALPGHEILRDPAETAVGAPLEVVLAKGRIQVKVVKGEG